MFARLLLLFTIVPAVELYLLLQLGQWLGPLPTVLLILGTGIVGATMAKREGLNVLQQIAQELERGIPPADRLVEGLLVLIGGVLLITPGVLTDLTGFALIAPPTRRLLAPVVRAWLGRHVKVGGNIAFHGFGAPPPPARREAAPAERFDHPTA